jgi:hypothetical protein
MNDTIEKEEGMEKIEQIRDKKLHLLAADGQINK